jgi:hypothetical protein
LDNLNQKMEDNAGLKDVQESKEEEVLSLFLV